MKLLIALLFPLFMQGQSIISCDDFENGLNGWQFTYPANHVNSWKVSTASGGSNAMFVTCDNINFNYCNATSGIERIVVWKQFNTAQCTGDLLITYNWIGVGQSYYNDYGAWSQCNGNPNSISSWNVFSSPHNASYWLQPASWVIPNNWYNFYSTTFKFGFIFECNSTVNGGTSFSFDNFCVKCFQAPLSIDTQQSVSNSYIISQNKSYKYYNFAGQEIKTPTGLCIRVDEYGNTCKLFIK